MNSPVENSGTPCPDSMLLEEYAVRYAKEIAPGSPDLEAHLSTCEKCRSLFEKQTQETRRLMTWLANPAAPSETCPPLEELGCYLDGTLSSPDRDAVESHLAHCSQCRAALAELYRETAALLAEETEGLPVMPVESPTDLLNHPAFLEKTKESPEPAFNMEYWLDTQESQEKKALNDSPENASNAGPNRQIGRNKR